MGRLERTSCGARKLGFSIATMVFAAFPTVAFSDVSYVPKSRDYLARIVVSGQIRPADVKQFISFAGMARNERQSPSYIVRLNSEGGDVGSAIAMGRIMRLDKAAVVILPDAKCFSSCIFLLAGGTRRTVYGPVGIHRPFAPVDSRTTEGLQKESYKRLEKEVKGFLRDVNISTELYDHMLRIPPHRVTIVTTNELQRYGLSEDDPYEDAARVATHARSLNITAEELIRRRARANSQCNSIINSDESGRCYMRIINEGR